MSSFKTPKGTELPILKLKGKDYLQVAHRLVWFREERPNWSIQTEFKVLAEKQAIAKATVLDSEGRIISTSHKSETVGDFPDFIEKAETGAIGRALALCGFGTQFAEDDLDEGKRLADSPVDRRNSALGIAPDQPGEGNGNTGDTSYRVTFGKWAQRSLEEIHRNHGDKAIADYISYLEESSAKKGQRPSAQVMEFIDRASQFLAAMEVSWANQAGARQ